MEGDGIACLGTCEHPDGGIGKFPGTVERGYHHRGCTISNRRTIEKPEGVRDKR